MRTPTCRTCLWWDPDSPMLATVKVLPGQTTLGWCRKHKPMFLLIEGTYHGAWGTTDADEGCGEHRKVGEG